MFCLKVRSDPGWAKEAVANFDKVLADHAHCEMKAASNALSLAARHPDDLALVRALTDLAKEELEHFQQVLTVLERRGIPLGPPEVDTYAADLRKSAKERPSGLPPLVDRLLVGALIEARSCERFKLLLGALDPAQERAIFDFYTELFAAEARHYRTFCDLAIAAAGGPNAREAVEARLETLSVLEGQIVSRLANNTFRGFIHG
ncbi:tRNA isopentenyl-2-thiomethyl-A-37 hydroxylase MiaE [Pendulispora albinea]|uniref:tRNA-(Ms[2]io[6]A)-hydroxylase n=1 Tax=Pendulispora albinea TaxID=2741071 RepID=A0ABZ2M2T9_9BACT